MHEDGGGYRSLACWRVPSGRCTEQWWTGVRRTTNLLRFICDGASMKFEDDIFRYQYHNKGTGTRLGVRYLQISPRNPHIITDLRSLFSLGLALSPVRALKLLKKCTLLQKEHTDHRYKSQQIVFIGGCIPKIMLHMVAGDRTLNQVMQLVEIFKIDTLLAGYRTDL